MGPALPCVPDVFLMTVALALCLLWSDVTPRCVVVCSGTCIQGSAGCHPVQWSFPVQEVPGGIRCLHPLFPGVYTQPQDWSGSTEGQAQGNTKVIPMCWPGAAVIAVVNFGEF